MAKPSPYFRERIITHRAKKLSYEKIRLEIQRENFKISKISIGKICRRFKNEHSIINNKPPGRNFIYTKKIMKYIDELISSDRSIKVVTLREKVSLKYKLKTSLSTIRRAAKRLKWTKKTTVLVSYYFSI